MIFHFATWNLENFFLPACLNPDNHQTTAIKPEIKIKQIAQTIHSLNPHMIALTEIGGENSLREFNEKFLGDEYHASLIPGNSDRGIEIGYLIKKDLPFRYQHYTHKNRELLSKPGTYYSRDIAELHVHNSASKTPCLIILAVHLKSKLNKEANDPGGKQQRAAELHTLVKLYRALNKKYENKVPIILAGDFNGRASLNNCEEEFAPLYKETDLKDFLEVMNWPEDKRGTFFTFQSTAQMHSEQLDYIFLSPLLQKNLIFEQSGIGRFRDEFGEVLPVPQINSLARMLPSDHYPLFASFKLTY